MYIRVNAIKYDVPEGVTEPEMVLQLRTISGTYNTCIMVSSIESIIEYDTEVQITFNSGNVIDVLETFDEVLTKIHSAFIFPSAS